MYLFLNEVKFNLWIKLSCLHKFSMSNNYMSSLRTTTCDALIVPSDYTKYRLPLLTHLGIPGRYTGLLQCRFRYKRHLHLPEVGCHSAAPVVVQMCRRWRCTMTSFPRHPTLRPLKHPIENTQLLSIQPTTYVLYSNYRETMLIKL